MYVCSFVSETFNLLNSNSVPSQILILCVPLNAWIIYNDFGCNLLLVFEAKCPYKKVVSIRNSAKTGSFIITCYFDKLFFAAVFYFTLQFATNPMIWRLFYAKARKCLRVKKLLILSQISEWRMVWIIKRSLDSNTF